MVASGCIVCGSPDCTDHPEIDHYEDYPFLPGGRPRVPGIEGIDWVLCTKAVSGIGADAGRKVYGVGDRVPMADAVRYGLVAGPREPAPKPKPRGKRKQSGRAKRPAEDRARKPAEDRS